MHFSWVTPEGLDKRIVFDTSDEEVPESSTTVTSHPIESGGNVNDHIIQNQTRIRLRATISNTPLHVPETQMRTATGETESVDLGSADRRSLTEGAQAGGSGDPTPAEYEDVTDRLSASVLKFSGEFDRVKDVYEELLLLQTSKQVFTLTTSLKVWENCTLQVLSAPRTAASGNAIEFPMDLVQLDFAESQTVEAPAPLQPRGRRQTARGSQNAEEVAEGSEDNRTLGARLDDATGQTLSRFGLSS